MPFEIFDKHEFGYNPEEINSIMSGVIVFAQGNQKYNNWEIFDANKKKIGYLSVNIKNRPIQAVSGKNTDSKLASPQKKVD